MTNQENSKSTEAEEILHAAKERFALAVEAEKEMRDLALEDEKFRSGEQWHPEIENERKADNRPCLTINRIPQFVRQVTNDQRQNRPSIKVNPVDEQADVDTAKILQGLIRHIEYNSNADVAYDTAFDGAAAKGLGYFRVITDYCDPMSFEQEILIKRIRNSFSVYMDPHYQQPDGSDANWAFVVENLSIEDFKAQYKDSDLATKDDWKSIGDSLPDWVGSQTVQVAEYFFKTFKETEIVLLSNKQVIELSQLEKLILPPEIQIVAQRKTILPAIKWVKINGHEILEETDWLGNWIPIIPVLGDERDIDGKRILEGIVRHAKDPQRMYNYWASSETESIALAPRAPFIGYAGQFTGFEDEWETANRKNHAFLQVNPVDVNGERAPLPQRNAYEAPVMAITNARMNSAEDLKATTGIYDASLGNRSNENSGVAIQRRNHQAQTNNYHYVDNLTRSIRHLGKILVDLIPKVYDTPRAVRILGEDGEAEIVKINQVFQKDGQEQKPIQFGFGKYDVTVSTGPNYATKRQEAVESMLALTQAMPQVMQQAADLLVKNMDWHGASEIAERLKKLLPPGLAEEKADEKGPKPAQLQAQLEQMGQMLEQVTSELNEARNENTPAAIKKMELESRERIEMFKIKTNIELEMAKMGSRESEFIMRNDVERIDRRLESELNMSEPIEIENEAAGSDQVMPPNDDQQQLTGESSPGQITGV